MDSSDHLLSNDRPRTGGGTILLCCVAASPSLFPPLRAQFARRDSVYYQSISAKAQDAFVIVCTITSSPSSSSLLPPGPSLSVPKPLIDTVGSLLDDPRYSDVEFVILRHIQEPQKARRIWASRKILQRAEHFDDSTCYSSETL